MVSFKSKQEAADTVEKWLREEDYDVTLVPDESADYNFMIVKGYMVLNVGFHKRSKDSLIVGGKIIFTPQEQSKIGYTTTKLGTRNNSSKRKWRIFVRRYTSIQDIVL